MAMLIQKIARADPSVNGGPISDIVKSMGPRTNRDKLRQKIRPGDIILTGRSTVYSGVPTKHRGKLWQKLFLHTLKPGAGSYTPHGMMALGTPGAKGKIKKHVENIIDQSEKVFVQKLNQALKQVDRFVVLRPKKKADRETLKKVLKHARGMKGAPYGVLSVMAQGAGQVANLPKSIRDMYTSKEGLLFCTSFLARAYEKAGENIVAGNARAALASDLLSSDKLKAVGWAGTPITSDEQFQVEVLPKIVAGTALAGVAGATAYGIKKIIGRYGRLALKLK